MYYGLDVINAGYYADPNRMIETHIADGDPATQPQLRRSDQHPVTVFAPRFDHYRGMGWKLRDACAAAVRLAAHIERDSAYSSFEYPLWLYRCRGQQQQKAQQRDFTDHVNPFEAWKTWAIIGWAYSL